MTKEKFSLTKRLKSFTYAFNGLKIMLKEEHNSRVHLVALISVVILGFVLRISSLEWIGIILSIGLVIAFELINSAIENLADFGTTELNEFIKKAKDLAAASVLWSAITALVVGGIVFIPKLLNLF